MAIVNMYHLPTMVAYGTDDEGDVPKAARSYQRSEAFKI